MVFLKTSGFLENQNHTRYQRSDLGFGLQQQRHDRGEHAVDFEHQIQQGGHTADHFACRAGDAGQVWIAGESSGRGCAAGEDLKGEE